MLDPHTTAGGRLSGIRPAETLGHDDRPSTGPGELPTAWAGGVCMPVHAHPAGVPVGPGSFRRGRRMTWNRWSTWHRWRGAGSPGTPGIVAYRAGHLPGAVFIDLDRDLSGPPGPGGRHPMPAVEAFQLAMRRAGVGDARDVVVYDEADATAAAVLVETGRGAGGGFVQDCPVPRTNCQTNDFSSRNAEIIYKQFVGTIY